MDNEIIDVKIGRTKIFHIHKDVLASAPFFQNALKPEWTRTRQKKPIELSDTRPPRFSWQ
jgi:hypothetical protein